MQRGDKAKRLAFARDIRKQFPGGSGALWKEGISFYFDGTGFVYKKNPLSMAVAPKSKAWRRENEGLSFGCTAKGKKEGTNQVRFFVGISYGKGVVLCEHYEGNVTGALIAEFVEKHFDSAFMKSCNPKGRRFLQDGDPSQNSARAKKALKKANALCFGIPPRSADLNPIENLFHLIGRSLDAQVLQRRIENETQEELIERVKETMLNFPIETIDAIIESMPKRIAQVLKLRGGKTKY